MLPSHRSGKQKRILQHHAETAAKFGQVHFFHIDAVDSDRAFLHVVEAHQQRDDRGLAGAGVADDGDGLAGFDGEGHIAENPVRLGNSRRASSAWTGRDPSQLGQWQLLWSRATRPRSCQPHRPHRGTQTRRDRTQSAPARRRFRNRGRSDLGRRVQQFEDAFAGRHRRLQNVVLLAEILNRPEEALRVLDESGQNSDADHSAHYVEREQVLARELRGDAAYRQAADDVIPAKPDHAGDRDRRQNFDHRVVDGVRHDRVFERVHVDGVHFGKLVEGALLAIEELQHHHAADVLLHVGVDAGDGGANAPVGVAHLVAENLGGDRRSAAAPRT